MELLIHGDTAVLDDGSPTEDGYSDPADLGIDEELATALHEWAGVAATLSNGSGPDGRVAELVSRRGRQLASRVADTMDAPVDYTDPVTGVCTTLRPRRRQGEPSPGARLIGTQPRTDDPVPWATGSVLAILTGVLTALTIIILASTLAARTMSWLAIVAAAVVSAGLAPSLWLGHRKPILRWVVLGAVCGIGCAWIGVAAIVF